MFLRISTLAVVVLGAGCTSGGAGDAESGSVHQDIQLCDGWLCGTNSPQIAEFGFWELNLPTASGTLGLPNNRGMQVVGFVQGTTVYLPRVAGGKLTASLGATTLSGAGLVGGWFYLRNGSRVFKLSVTEVGSVDSWAQPPSQSPHVTLESYKLDWSELVNGGWGDARNACPHPPSREDGDALTMTGTYAFHTLLFEGDRIDPIKKLDTGIDITWFNLGCAGSALAKMALTGHTEAARAANTFDTTLTERQTMLKMLAADYCGDGMPFTVPGQPLNWQDDHGTMKLLSLPQQLSRESRWTEKGATCLDKPRVDIHPTTLSIQTFGANVNIYDLVQSHCPLQLPPQCADTSLALDGYHLLSATPF